MAENAPPIEGGNRQPERTYDQLSPSPQPILHRDRLLLECADLVVRTGSDSDLFQEFAPRILALTGCDFLKFSLHDRQQNCMLTRYWKNDQEGPQLDAFAVEDCVSGWVWKQQEATVIPDVASEKRFPLCMQQLREHGVQSYSVLPVTTATRRLGAIGLGKNVPEALDLEDLKFFGRVAFMVGLALENQNEHRDEEQQRHRLQSLVTIAQELNSTLELDRLLPIIFQNVRQIINCDYVMVALLEEDKKYIRLYDPDWIPGLTPLTKDGHRREFTAKATARKAIETRAITLWSPEELASLEIPMAREMHSIGVHSLCNVPLITGNEVLGTLNLGSLRKDAFRFIDLDYLQKVANHIAVAIRNANTYREIAQLKERFAREKRYLENEIRTELCGAEIVGRTNALKRVLDYASIVAATDSTVLITGDTGTGKELIARAIHGMSRRKDRTFIKLNCAAIPTGLLESELFGHEKGAFTGAVSQKIGRLELADKGTLFLDEIGEIALELQPKLLRVLQDQEFERLGGTRTIRVDARLIAATNRDLLRAVEAKEFRSDLFYRLHVFPLHLPTLRERSEDIPALVQHFVEKSSARLGRRIESIPEEAMAAIRQWTWPGNIRELENFIERSVILSEGPVLRVPLSELRQEIARQQSGTEGTLHDIERDHIIDILHQTRGVLSGPRGAASRLGLKRTTLQYKLQKLGISRTEYLG